MIIDNNYGHKTILVSWASLLFLDNSLVKLPCASGDSGWEASTHHDAVVMQQFCMLMTFNVTTRAWEFSQTLNHIILGLARETSLVAEGEMLGGNVAKPL